MQKSYRHYLVGLEQSTTTSKSLVEHTRRYLAYQWVTASSRRLNLGEPWTKLGVGTWAIDQLLLATAHRGEWIVYILLCELVR